MNGYINNTKKRGNGGGDMGSVSNKNMSKSVLGGTNSIEDDIYQNSGKDKKGGNRGF